MKRQGQSEIKMLPLCQVHHGVCRRLEGVFLKNIFQDESPRRRTINQLHALISDLGFHDRLPFQSPLCFPSEATTLLSWCCCNEAHGCGYLRQERHRESVWEDWQTEACTQLLAFLNRGNAVCFLGGVDRYIFITPPLSLSRITDR